MFRKLCLVSLFASAAVAACGSSDRDPLAKNAGGPNAQGNGEGGAPGAIGSQVEPGDARPDPVGTLTGKVFMPEGTIPVSDALVYLTNRIPDPIPSGAYCDKCISLDSYAFTYSKADGSFELPAYQLGEQYLVVQKGQFRRYRPYNVTAGAQAIYAGQTTLPGKNNAQLGDDIPKMLVWPGTWDHVEKSLKKIGVTEFDKFDPGLNLGAYSQKMQELSSFHMVFLPCSGGVQLDQNPKCSVNVDQQLLSSVKDFVGKGGKLYVTDWSYEYVRQGWPGGVTWEGETQQLGSACEGGGGDGPANWDDSSLNAWMNAIGEGNAHVQGAWTRLKSVQPVNIVDENGATVQQTPKVWVSSGGRPTTVSFQDRCGRVLYSTYHTEGSDSVFGQGEFLAQEKALMHILLEVGVCVGVKPQPPPR